MQNLVTSHLPTCHHSQPLRGDAALSKIFGYLVIFARNATQEPLTQSQPKNDRSTSLANSQLSLSLLNLLKLLLHSLRPCGFLCFYLQQTFSELSIVLVLKVEHPRSHLKNHSSFFITHLVTLNTKKSDKYCFQLKKIQLSPGSCT